MRGREYETECELEAAKSMFKVLTPVIVIKLSLLTNGASLSGP
jgi:hypothetical protein